MALSTSNLKQLVEYQSKSERFEMFDGQGKLVLVVARFLIKLLSEDNEILESLKSLEELAALCWSYSHHSQQDRKFSESFWNFVEHVQVFFKVPHVMTIVESNELVAAFIDLLLEIIEEILNLQLYFIHRVEDSMKKLKMELKYLLTFVGDMPSQPMELETTKNMLATVEGISNDVGRFLYSFFFNKKRISVIEMKQKLDGLLGDIEKLKENIKIHCVTIVKMLPNWVSPKIEIGYPTLVLSVVDYLDDLMNHEDQRIVGLTDQIRTIHQDFTFLRSILRDIYVERHPKFRELAVKLRDAAYEVEYILQSFSPKWYLTLRISYIIKKIQLIKMSIAEMNQGKYNAGIASKEASILAAVKTFEVFEDTIVGFREEVMQIMHQLIGGTKDLQVICINGMPGLGKTTIAMTIYNHRSIRIYFDMVAWCSISETYQMRNVLIDILSCVSHINKLKMLTMDQDDLAEQLYKSIKGYRYLIVIDNILDENMWYDIQRFFPDDRCGSRVLFTSPLENVFLLMPSVILKLHFLSPEECWDLLCLKVFHKYQCPPELACVGKKIALNCGGVPLTVIKIALVLANVPKESTFWMEVAANILSHISNENDEFMEQVYNYLPMHLKPCFLYFGVFERGMEIPAQKLLLLWDAEGFIKHEEHKSSEDLAEEYLMDLISRNVVLVAKRRSDGRVKSCTIQPIIYDVCLRIAQRENFVKVIKDRLSIYEQHHHLSIHSRSIPSFSRAFGLRVRSLSGNLPDPSAFMFGSLKCLKVLDLPTIDFSPYDLKGSEFFGVLKFLSVSSIPPSLEIFKNLESLFVDNKEVVEIPTTLLNMVKLRHVHFSGNAQFSESWCSKAPQAEKFQISHLQNLSSIFIYDENDEKILRLFPHLRTLKGRFTVFWESSENVYRYPALNCLEQLQSLNISFVPSYASSDIAPKSLSLPSSLKKLTLRNFDLSRNHMKTIAELPNLEVLKLRDDAIEGKQWDTNEDEFMELKYLELDSVQIEHWNNYDDCFPSLQTLVLVRCQILEEIPPTLGHLLTLQKIEVHGCTTSVEISASQIQEEQLEYGNDVKIIISSFSL